MIGLDTNALVRYLVRDDEAQVAQVERWLREAEAANELLHVDVIVLCELVWVLGSVYKYGREEIANAISHLLDAEQVSISDRHLVRRALERYREERGDVSDYLIGERNLASGCRATKTFDEALSASDLFEGVGRTSCPPHLDSQDEGE